MAYCVTCGAYIADGAEKCPACGRKAGSGKSDDGKGSAQSSSGRAGRQAGGSAQQQQQQQRQQRQQQRQQQNNQRGGNSGKYEYWQDAQNTQNRDRSSSNTYSDPWNEQKTWSEPWNNQRPRNEPWREPKNAWKTGNAVNVDTDRLLGLLCYLGPLLFIPYGLKKDSSFIKFHANQGLVLFILSVLCSVVSNIIVFGWLVSAVLWVYCLVSFLKGISNVLHGRMKPLPFLGEINILK